MADWKNAERSRTASVLHLYEFQTSLARRYVCLLDAFFRKSDFSSLCTVRRRRGPCCGFGSSLFGANLFGSVSPLVLQWSYLPQSGDPVTAWNALISAVTQLPESTVVEATNNYIRAEFPAFPKGIDDVEFLLNEAEVIHHLSMCSFFS